MRNRDDGPDGAKCTGAELPVRLPHLIVIALLATMISSCVYERIDIIAGSDSYSGWVMSHPDDVEVRASGILLKPGARFSVKTPFVTQFLAQMDVAILSGTGMRVYLRTTRYDLDPDSSMALTYSTEGFSMRDPDGRVRPIEFNAETGQQMLTISHEASLVTVLVGCEKVYEAPTTVPTTEYLIFETLPGSAVEIRSINYFHTDSAHPERK